MHLTPNEIVYLLKTWNGWYLTSHDEYLNSNFSDNELSITIEPFQTDKISEEVEDDLRDYTDDIDLQDPNRFKIGFLFSAKDQQPDIVFKSLKPIFEKAVGSKIEISNTMKFIELDLPEESEVTDQVDKTIKEAIDKYKALNPPENDEPEELKEEDREKENTLKDNEADKDEADSSEDEEKEQADDVEESSEEDTPDDEVLRNSILISGIIDNDYIDIDKILHNGEEFENLDLFREAARVYETVDRNFKEPEKHGDMNPYECADESEAAQVSLFLGTTTDHRPQSVEGTTLYTGAYPEELAAIISYVRYKKVFKLFSNPYIERLRAKRKMSKAMVQKFYRQSCSCIMLAMMTILFLILWFILSSKK